jgi:hypothetical protein
MENDYAYNNRASQINASQVYNEYGTEIEEDPETYRNDNVQGNGLRKRQVGGDDPDGAIGIEMEQNSSGEESHQLIKKSKIKKSDQMPRCYALRRWFGCIISKERRNINLDGKTSPSRYPTNK